MAPGAARGDEVRRRGRSDDAATRPRARATTRRRDDARATRETRGDDADRCERVDDQIRASALVRVACATTIACVVTTYAFATTQSAIATNVFPIISETFAGTPQSAVSEFALGFASWVLFFTVAVVKSYCDRYATSDERWRAHGRRSARVGYAAAICLALTAAISYAESFGAHVTAAFGFLFALWMWLACVVAQLTKTRGRGESMQRAREGRRDWRSRDWASAGSPRSRRSWARTRAATAYSLIGFCEWLAVLALVAACYTTAWDFDAKGVSIRVCFDEPRARLAPSNPRRRASSRKRPPQTYSPRLAARARAARARRRRCRPSPRARLARVSRPRPRPARAAIARARRASRRARAAASASDTAASRGVDGGAYARELETALDAVRLASTLCQEVQAQLMRMDEQAETKEDRSLVTLADYAAQAIIAWCARWRATTAIARRTIDA